MTEQEAKTKWCPHARIFAAGDDKICQQAVVAVQKRLRRHSIERMREQLRQLEQSA